MDAIILQILNGLDKGGAYALIALGLTLIFGTLGVVNFAHGALFMLGAFCAVTLQTAADALDARCKDPSRSPSSTPTRRCPTCEIWLGDVGRRIIDYSVPLSILLAIPVMLLIGLAMERGLIRFFYKRPHAEQILVTFGLAIVLQEIVKEIFGANPIPVPAPPTLSPAAPTSAPGSASAPASSIRGGAWSTSPSRLVVIGVVFAFLQFTTYGMVVRAGMHDRETVGLLGINIQRRFTIVFGIAAVVAGLAGVMYTPILPPDYHMGMDFLVLSFVVVVVGGMGSLAGAVLAGFLLGILQSFASMNEVKSIVPGIDQIIIYLVAVVDPAGPAARPAGPQGRDGGLSRCGLQHATLRNDAGR